MPIIMVTGKKIIPRTKNTPFKSDKTTNENPKMPTRMLITTIVVDTTKSLKIAMKIKSREKRMNKISLKGAFSTQAIGLLQNY